VRSCLVLLVALGCGDNTSPPATPLEDDPAVRRGCEPIGADPEPFSRVKRVDCVEELPSGPLVGGQVGDILIENDRIQVVMRASGEGYLFPGAPPGSIVDAARRGADDQLHELYPLVELNISDASEMALTEAGDDGPATVVVRGPAVPFPYLVAILGTQAAGLMLEHHFVLEPGATYLTMRTIVTPIPGVPGPADLQAGDLIFFGGRVNLWIPGVGEPSGAATGPMLASSGSATTSYGFVFTPPVEEAYLIDVGVQAVMGPRRLIDDPRPVERHLIVGDGSASSVTDVGYAIRGETARLSGTLSPLPPESSPWTEVAIDDAAGDPVTVARAGASGEFHADLPPGQYQVRAASPGHAAADPAAASAGDSGVEVALGPTGVLEIAVSSGGSPMPARVQVTPAGGEAHILYVGASGELAVALPPGSYGIDVSRGVEYDAFSAVDVEVTAGAVTEVVAELERVVDTAGWIAIDPHLHSEMSPDSSIPLSDRLLAVAAEGVELAIATDHDFLTDYGPYVASLGLGDHVAFRGGTEVSSRVWGHVNAWPLVQDRSRGGLGALDWFQKSPGQIFEELRARGDEVVVQVNHPRRSNSYFDAIEFDPDTAMATRDPAELGLDGADLSDFNFDAVEVANGKTDPFELTFADWLGLIAAGHPTAGTGSSDSHNAAQFVGSSRTYVWVGEGADDPATLDLDAVDIALRARMVTVSQGAFVTAALRDPADNLPAEPGEVVDLSEAPMARLHVTVQAPPWMPLLRLRVYHGRTEATTIELDPEDTEVVRYDDVILLPLGEADSFFVVLVEPAGDAPPVLEELGASFTNPLLYHRDGDLTWSPQ
jgi:hypothetical protein